MQHIGRQRNKLVAIAVTVLVGTIGFVLARPGAASAASADCSAGSTMIIVAHQDDPLLFLNPDLIHAIQNGRCVRTVFVTAGDDGQGQSYWSSREKGAEAAYSEMAGVANTWTQSDAGVAGHPIPVMTLSTDPNISLVFMRLPDGNIDGSGFASQGFESLQKLYTGDIPQMTADDGSSSYTLGTLISTLSSLVTSFAPNAIWTQDYAGSYGDGDHSDHHTVAYLTREVSRAWTTSTHTLTGYMGYASQGQPPNVTGSNLTAKEDTWFTYAPFDYEVCQDVTSCQQTSYWGWLNAQYTIGTETDVASAGPNSSVIDVSVTGTTAVVTFTSDDAGATYQCSLDGGPFANCTSPATFSGLSAGTHTFAVRGTDADGNLGNVASRQFVIADNTSTGGGTVTTPRDTVAPKLVITPKSLRLSKAGWATLKVKCPATEKRCTVVMRVKLGGKTVAQKAVTILGGKTMKVSLKMSLWARAQLAKHGRLNVTVIGTATDAAGNVKATSIHVTIKPASTRR
jgi:LmbE family N-acetylglucosaminyl deacetylase